MAYERLVERARVIQARSTVSAMATTVTIQVRSGLDSYGEPAYDAGVPHAAVVDFASRRVTTPQGDEVQSRGEARIGATTPEVSTMDKLILPNGETPRILNVEKVWVGGALITQKVQF